MATLNRKTFIALLLTVSPIVMMGADHLHPLLGDFFASVKESRHEEFKKYLNTPLQKEAMEYITNPAKMYLGTAPEGADPHTKAGVTKKEIKIPHWVEAAKAMHKSTMSEKNPISANAGIIIIKSYLGKNNKEFLPLYKDMATVLAGSKTCNGLLEYADVLDQGIATAVNPKKAYETLLEAKKECAGITSKWQANVIEMKLARLSNNANAKK